MALQRLNKPVIFTIAALSITAAVVMACASQVPRTGRPAITLKGLTLSQEVIEKGNSATPKGVSRTFRTTDKSLAALISFNNLYGVIDLRWDWFGPDRALYLSKQAKTLRSGEGSYYREFNAWHVLTIAGDKAATMPGEWSVNVYMNDTLLLSQGFSILEAGLE